MPRGSGRSRRARSSRRSSSSRAMPGYGLVAAAAGIGLWFVLTRMVDWQPYLIWLVAWGVTAFTLYGWDKSQSQGSGWRVPEMVLHALALVGGVAGAWLGMLFFRHKTQKPEFGLVLLFATIVHGAIALSVLA